MIRSSRIAFYIWAAITLLVAASLLFIYLRWGTVGFDIFIQQWPLTDLPTALASVALTWLLAGVLVYCLQAGRINKSNLLAFAGFFLVAWEYLNFLREHFRYGDFTYYFDAATALSNHQHLPGSYFYPPLWATLTQYIIPFGEESFLLVLWILNFIALMAFFVLTLRMLERYGFSPRLSALTVTLFTLVNTPLLRTLDYVQVNVHTLNFVFLGILLFPKRPFLSALMMAIAVHLKSSPAVLALAFLLEKDWRWLAWFVLWMVLIAALTFATNGIMPFLDYLQNIQQLAASPNITYHDTSFDTFLRFWGLHFHLGTFVTRGLIYAAKALLGIATLFVMVQGVRIQMFFTGDERGGKLLNAIPPLFVLMTLASPVVWEHHGIFTALAFLLMLKKLDAPSEWMWFGFAYFFEFIVPTFDFFPWSYGRLVAPMIILWLMWATSKRTVPSATFSKWISFLEFQNA
jgi:hypothetical protein